MSAARSLKMPFRPLYDAIASTRSAIRSNTGPAVSDRWYRRRSPQPWPVSGFSTRTYACGFSAMFRRLLLKNWNERATWDASTYSTWLRYAAFAIPSAALVYSVAGMRPWKQGVRDSRFTLIAAEHRHRAQASDRRDPSRVRAEPPTARWSTNLSGPVGSRCARSLGERDPTEP